MGARVAAEAARDLRPLNTRERPDGPLVFMHVRLVSRAQLGPSSTSPFSRAFSPWGNRFAQEMQISVICLRPKTPRVRIRTSRPGPWTVRPELAIRRWRRREAKCEAFGGCRGRENDGRHCPPPRLLTTELRFIPQLNTTHRHAGGEESVDPWHRRGYSDGVRKVWLIGTLS